MSNRKSTLSVQYMTRIAILGALSAILFMIEIPVVAFYKLDVSTLPALLGAFSMGPWAGLGILLIKDLFGLLHSGTMYVGELADFIMGAAFILPAELIYRHKKSRKTRHSIGREGENAGHEHQKGAKRRNHSAKGNFLASFCHKRFLLSYIIRFPRLKGLSRRRRD